MGNPGGTDPRAGRIGDLLIIGVHLALLVSGWHREAPLQPQAGATVIQRPGSDTVAAETDSGSVSAAPINLDKARVVAFAKTLKGRPYRFGGTDPATGFDCSGFITYVFRHFATEVPRSSVDFTNYGTTVPLALSRSGDLILFTGTDSTDRTVGHMGIITYKSRDSTAFIHSTSGKQYGVVETPLNVYYQGRFVKVVRY